MSSVSSKITAVLMIAILLLSTSSFSIYKHFCGGDLVEISLEKVECCCKSKTSKTKPFKLYFSEKGCCENESEINSIFYFESTKSIKLVKSDIVFITSFYYSFIKKLNVTNTSKNYFRDNSPLKLVCNKQVLYQTFLI